jgi:hypothetical protein
MVPKILEEGPREGCQRGGGDTLRRGRVSSAGNAILRKEKEDGRTELEE